MEMKMTNMPKQKPGNLIKLLMQCEDNACQSPHDSKHGFW